MTTKLKQFLAYVEPAMFDELHRLAKITRIPRAVLVREAFDDLLKKYTKVLKNGGKK